MAWPRRSRKGTAGIRLRGYLMTGVSYMIPFVAGGGILIALSFMLGGYEIVAVSNDRCPTAFIDQFSFFDLNDWAGLMFILGAVAFGFLNAVLAGFIAYAIADRPGLVPGFVGGVAAGTIGAGFLGAIVGGLTGGFIAALDVASSTCPRRSAASCRSWSSRWWRPSSTAR